MNLQPACVWLRRWRELDSDKRLVSDHEAIVGLYESLAAVVGSEAIAEKYDEYVRGDGGPVAEGVALLRDAYELRGLRGAIKAEFRAKRGKKDGIPNAVSQLPNDNLTKMNAERVWSGSGKSRQIVADAVELILAANQALDVKLDIELEPVNEDPNAEIEALLWAARRWLIQPSSCHGPASNEQIKFVEFVIEHGGRCTPEAVSSGASFDYENPLDGCKQMCKRIKERLKAARQPWAIVPSDRAEVAIVPAEFHRP
jgi:hypothetical protein